MMPTPNWKLKAEHLENENSKLRAANVRLRAALRDLIADIEDYERVNNLSPSPGRKDCWQSVTNARRALELPVIQAEEKPR